ncbi:MAG TPA: hypothetical protein VMU27_02280 [Candidatus Paceibacterota bacterium]|nr:hypothetical protein [Candidatus Paceibacterota bacterium]
MQAQNGVTVTGICDQAEHCHATGATGVAGGSGAGLSSLGSLAQTLGQLLGQLMKGGSGSGSGSGDNSGSGSGLSSVGSTCVSYYPESTTPYPTDPCSYYVPNQTCPEGETGTYPNCVSSTGTCSLTDQLAGTCNGSSNVGCPSGDTGTYPDCIPPGGTCSVSDQLAGNCNTGTSSCPSGDTGTYPNCVSGGVGNGGDTVSVSPASGVAPLSVTATFSSGTSCDDAYDLSWGDGSSDVTMQYVAPSGGACASLAQVHNPPHTYSNSGTYTITLLSGTSLQYTSSATVVVAAPTINSGSGTTATSNNTNTSGNNTGTAITTNTTTNTSGNTGTTSNGTESIGANITGVFIPNTTGSGTTNPPPAGITGSIESNPTGATFEASDVSTGTETSLFFGGDTIAGFVTNLIASWCQSRPWATGFIADIIPPSFFDGLCASGGFAVGEQVPVAGTTATNNIPATNVVLTQTPVSHSSTASNSTTQTGTAPFLPPRVDIWAVPSSVPLGSRTTIYWNTENVSDCTESSPDGSFSASSLTGGGATVPLTQPTTYTISCLDSEGNPTTEYVTVGISN